MNYYQYIEKAIVFIEENLSSKIVLDDIAEAACLSKFHFHRVFNSLMGETAIDYVRKRRLSKASYDLLYTDNKIIDIAFEYQFESPEAFTRAFKSVFNITPKNYRGERIERIVYQKQQINEDNLSHFIHGINKKPAIIELDKIKIIGFSTKTSIKDNKVPYVWKIYRENSNQIRNVSPDNSTIGLYEKPMDYTIDEFSEETELNLIYGKVVEDLSDIPDKMVSGIVPQGRYAKFTHKGNVHSIKLTYVYIFGSWLPKSGHKLSMNPDFERFDERFRGPFNEKSEIDIYIAIA